MTEQTPQTTVDDRVLQREMVMPDSRQVRDLMDRGWCVSRIGRGWYCRGMTTLWWTEAVVVR